ncbi:hypothetical protein [Streptomyces sp. Caat 7-52]|uniref:hypothetical protein n=1 Tax=Streptomyces sp. Caat 7-52 TaxID=2949637 RepID=UPI002035FC99|nr:hypothetical protein [Streptomyces sp. Caat 7-52]
MATTRFTLLVQERHWDSYERFCIHFSEAARRAAERENDPRLARADVSLPQFLRPVDGPQGDVQRHPRRDAYLVLRHMFNMSPERLFQQVEPLSRPAIDFSAGAAAPPAQAPEFDDPLAVVAQTHRLTGSNADDAVLMMVTQSIASIASRYDALGPHQLAGEARVIRGCSTESSAANSPHACARNSSDSPPRPLLGYMAVNAGARFEVVNACCVEADSLTNEIGEISMQIWATGTRSLGLYYQKRYAEADDAASAGIALDPDNPQAIRLLVNGRSRALGRLGDRGRAEAAIGRAIDLSDRQLSIPDGLTSCISFDPYSMPRTLANAITTRLSLGDTAEVVTHAAEIEDLVAHSPSDWSRALVGLDVASALLKQDSPEVEHAMALGGRALRAGTGGPSGRSGRGRRSCTWAPSDGTTNPL